MKVSRRYSYYVILLCWLAYIFSYMGRTGYSACLATILESTSITKATAGIVSSSLFFCNAIGQLISCIIVPKLPPVKTILAEVICVSIFNLVFSFEQSVAVMAILWGLNGFVQSAMMCAITQLFVTHIEEPYISKGIVLINTVASIGSALIYITAWFFTSRYTWRHQFRFLSLVLIIFSLIWFLFFRSELIIHPSSGKKHCNHTSLKYYLINTVTSTKKLLPWQVAVPLFICSFSSGFIRDGVLQWIPVYLKESYSISASFSTLVTFFVPLLQTSGAFLAGYINSRSNRLFRFTTGFYLLSFACMFILYIFNSASLFCSVLLFVVNAGSATALITLLMSLVPLRFFDKAHCVMLVGILNFCTHMGSFFSSYTIGLFSEIIGWPGVITLLSVVAFISALCAVSLNHSQTNGVLKTY